MNPLLLGGFGVRLRVSRIQSLSELWVMDGRQDKDLGRMFRFQPRRCPYSSIVIDGHSGYISLQALHWLSRNNVPVFVMNYDGSLISVNSSTNSNPSSFTLRSIPSGQRPREEIHDSQSACSSEDYPKPTCSRLAGGRLRHRERDTSNKTRSHETTQGFHSNTTSNR